MHAIFDLPLAMSYNTDSSPGSSLFCHEARILPMQIHVRVNGPLSRSLGRARFTVDLTNGATIADLITLLRTQYPEIANALNYVVPVLSGRHCTPSTVLVDGQEVALLMPVAGG
jgi:sulfur-carrier protein